MSSAVTGIHCRWWIVVAALVVMAALARAEEEPELAYIHCSQLAPLTVDAAFPRCSALELEVAGFPDHLHRHTWSEWATPMDADGNSYGPESICLYRELLDRDDLGNDPDEKRVGQFIFRHNPGYSACDMFQWLELMEWAHHDVAVLLGLDVPDTLTMINPDNTNQYQQMTGQGVWRRYLLDGNQAIIEPYPVLMARTIEAHAAFQLVTDWILRGAISQGLPPWLHQGLIDYIGENGNHLETFMAEFAVYGPVLMSPPLVNAILLQGVNPDLNKDRENFRRASYSAFLMVWQLVENEGGILALQDLLARLASGENIDNACTAVYGMDLALLERLLDPANYGEPTANPPQRQAAHLEP